MNGVGSVWIAGSWSGEGSSVAIAVVLNERSSWRSDASGPRLTALESGERILLGFDEFLRVPAGVVVGGNQIGGYWRWCCCCWCCCWCRCCCLLCLSVIAAAVVTVTAGTVAVRSSAGESKDILIVLRGGWCDHRRSGEVGAGEHVVGWGWCWSGCHEWADCGCWLRLHLWLRLRSWGERIHLMETSGLLLRLLRLLLLLLMVRVWWGRKGRNDLLAVAGACVHVGTGWWCCECIKVRVHGEKG
mmetsp:Transcript_14653/g.40470  ORF Transcript_14653/g.40470 Transcript_14653/m.40470 type:complete len:244 (+) Transcript_14653:682-1413(+)